MLIMATAGIVSSSFYAALDEPTARRQAFLTTACGSDVELLREVESLLGAHASGDEMLERPAIAHIGMIDTPVDPPDPWTPGTTFGHYRILESLGAGGMGQVFRAQDLLLDRQVALKTLPPDLSLDRSYLERLRREARLLAAVNHPNVAALYEVEKVGASCLVMGLVEGETLAARLSRSRLPVSATIVLATQIAGALEARAPKGCGPSRSEAVQRYDCTRRSREGGRFWIGEARRRSRW